jgi:oligopeptide transport system ATP-binding protein
VYYGRRGQLAEAAVYSASITVGYGECLGIVGESGSGKTTLANCLAGLLRPTSGRVLFRGEVVNEAARAPTVPRVRGVQIVFQDPGSSLNPRRTVGSVLREILSVHRLVDRKDVTERLNELLRDVGLPSGVAGVRPARLSGGQQQRVAIARALAFNPRLMVADEIVSALDASVQAQILNLLDNLRSRLGLSIVLITHDMAVARQLCDRLAVMRQSEIVEVGGTDSVLGAPAHDYTKALLEAVPRLSASGPDSGLLA